MSGQSYANLVNRLASALGFNVPPQQSRARTSTAPTVGVHRPKDRATPTTLRRSQNRPWQRDPSQTDREKPQVSQSSPTGRLGQCHRAVQRQSGSERQATQGRLKQGHEEWTCYVHPNAYMTPVPTSPAIGNQSFAATNRVETGVLRADAILQRFTTATLCSPLSIPPI